MIALDTNILVYAFDNAYPEKRDVCKKLVSNIFMGKQKGVVTNQILAEFSAVVTRKMERPLTKDEARSIVGAILSSENWIVFDYNGETVLCALNATKPFWDALIIETLKQHGISKIVTENTRHFEGSGITVINPF